MALRTIAFLAVLSCAACAPRPGDPRDETGLAPAARTPAAAGRAGDESSPLILYDAPLDRAYMQALTQGELRREGDCVYLVHGEHRTLLVLPSPTARWDAERGSIRFGDRELRFGEQAAFGGGEVGIGTGPEAAEARRRGCDSSSVWWASPETVEQPLPSPVPVPPPSKGQ